MRQPLYFDAGSRRLFGLFHPRAGMAAARRGVLLCNPFGREAIRAHRVFRVLAERLARAGCDVLRFDYFATGDSPGEDAQVDFHGWQDDVRAAHFELGRLSGAPAISWLGLRLGAAAALNAAARGDCPRLDRLVLWDPVLDGRDYLDLIRARHLEWEFEGSGRTPDLSPVFRANPGFYIDEAIGFPISRALCDQIRAWRFTGKRPAGVETHVLVDSNDEGRAVARVCRESGGELPVTEIAHATDWTLDRDTSGLVPPPVINLLFERAGGRS